MRCGFTRTPKSTSHTLTASRSIAATSAFTPAPPSPLPAVTAPLVQHDQDRFGCRLPRCTAAIFLSLCRRAILREFGLGEALRMRGSGLQRQLSRLHLHLPHDGPQALGAYPAFVR